MGCIDEYYIKSLTYINSLKYFRAIVRPVANLMSFTAGEKP